VTLSLYFDHHVPYAVTSALRLRAVDIVTAAEDGMARSPDQALLDRAAESRRALVTFDHDFLTEAAARAARQEPFAPVLFARPRALGVGRLIRELLAIAQQASYEELADRVTYLLRQPAR
jgi:predicted nuclease of predicted toxin-antitoxin system